MPVQIGQLPGHDFNEPLGLLSDCHRRIERFLQILIRVTEVASGRELNAEERTALSGALKYFAEAAPKHTADEEESLFPRLRAVGGAEVDAALATVEQLESEHVRADRLHREVHELGDRWLREGTLPGDSAVRLGTLLRELEQIYGKHIEIEDNQLFPLAERVLPDADRQAIGREMAARRSIPLS